MKLTKFFMFAATALTFAACSNDEDVTVKDPNADLPKEVTLSIANLQAPKAGSRALEGQVAAGQIALKEAYVLFFDGGGNVVPVSGENQAKQQLDIATIAGTPVKFEGLPKEVQQVGVFANYTTAGVDVKNVTSLKQLRQQNLALGTQQDEKDIYMSGAMALGAAETTGGVNFYKVSVTLAPRVSRLEITGFKCTDFVTTDKEPKTFTSIKVEQLALNGYYINRPVVGEPKDNKYVDDEKKYIDFLDQAANENPAEGEFYKPAFTFDLIKDATLTSSAPEKEYTPQAFGYNFFNCSDELSSAIPGLLIGMRVAIDGVQGEKNVYLKVNTYSNTNGGVINTSEAGKVYRVNMAFDADDLNQYATKDVEVTVVPAEWVIVPVTPNYE